MIEHPDITYYNNNGELPESIYAREAKYWEDWDESFEMEEDYDE